MTPTDSFAHLRDKSQQDLLYLTSLRSVSAAARDLLFRRKLEAAAEAHKRAQLAKSKIHLPKLDVTNFSQLPH